MTPDPYDELPYRALPIEWTAPERLATASLLHGGPRPPLRGYRVLELGCADGANLLPQAYYRRHATFVGVDGAASQVALARARRSALRLSNVDFMHADILAADDRLDGAFDYIICHGVFSWVAEPVRDALLRLCARRLRTGGLLYLNYNAHPGWKIRGMVREFLQAQTAGAGTLRERAGLAQRTAAAMAESLGRHDHLFSRLLGGEFQFVCDNDVSYVAHEYLSPENHAYWRSEFLALARQHGLGYVADADFNYHSGRLPADLDATLATADIVGRSPDDTIDLVCYRQLHSPILTRSPFTRREPGAGEFANLTVASCLTPRDGAGGSPPMFQHPDGYEVEAKEAVMHAALTALRDAWPRGLRVGTLFPDVPRVMDDLRLLHRNGLIDLRYDAAEDAVNGAPLQQCEHARGYFTTAYHTREAAVG